MAVSRVPAGHFAEKGERGWQSRPGGTSQGFGKKGVALIRRLCHRGKEFRNVAKAPGQNQQKKAIFY
jgi:hypothetical protein